MKLAVQTDQTHGGHDLYDCSIDISRNGGNVQINLTNRMPGEQKGGSLEITRSTAKKLAYALLFATAAGTSGTASFDVKEVPDWEPAHSDVMTDRHGVPTMRD